jgi:tetratricopeptide (TPR) repeat protein
MPCLPPTHAPPPRRARPGQGLRPALLLGLLLAGCGDNRSERELAIAASALVTEGSVAPARDLFLESLRRFPESVELRLRWAEFALQQGEMDRADTLLNEIDALDPAEIDARRAADLRRQWLVARMERAAGESLIAPRDREVWEESLRALLHMGPDADLAETWGRYLLERARLALGEPPERTLERATLATLQETLDPVTAARTLRILDQLYDEDPQALLPPPRDAEARALREVLRAVVFAAEFDARFANIHRRRLVDARRFDPVAQRFVHRWTTGGPPGTPQDAPPDVWEQIGRYWVARQVVAQIARELLVPPPDDANPDPAPDGAADPLPLTLADMGPVGVEVLPPEVEGAPPTLRLTIPWPLVRRAAFLLHGRRRDQAAAPDPRPLDEPDAFP